MVAFASLGLRLTSLARDRMGSHTDRRKGSAAGMAIQEATRRGRLTTSSAAVVSPHGVAGKEVDSFDLTAITLAAASGPLPNERSGPHGDALVRLGEASLIEGFFGSNPTVNVQIRVQTEGLATARANAVSIWALGGSLCLLILGNMFQLCLCPRTKTFLLNLKGA